MALTIQEDKSALKDLVTADRKLWLDSDGKAVEDGDPEARTLFCGKGHKISRAAAEKAGATFGVKANKAETKKAPVAKRKTATKKRGK